MSSSQSGRGDGEVLVDPDRAQLRGGMRHLKRSAEGVKTSKSSPTGYKLASTGQPCDRHGRVVAGSSSSAASASASAGQHISLPAYYHCTGDESFDSMMSSEHSRIKVATPRTGTGGAGAWLSTAPETRVYGPYIMAFNHHLDLIHSTTSHAQGRASVRTDLHIGIQEAISLNGRNSGITEPPLSLIGVPAAEVEFYKAQVGRLNGNLHFNSADGGTDVAVFSSETVQKLALLLNQFNAKKVPQGW